MNQDDLKTIEKVFPKVEGISELNEMVFHFGDINMVINSSGDVLKVSTPKGSPLTDLSDWTNKNMNDLLTLESREKFDAHMESISEINRAATRSFELNHISAKTGEFPVRYKGIRIGRTSNILLVGTDLTPVAEIQKKFVNSQLALEREYTKYRNYETRYKVLIEFTTDPIIVIDAYTGLIIDSNPSGQKIFTSKKEKFVGQKIDKFISWDININTLEVLKSDATANLTRTAVLKDKEKSPKIKITPTIFRAENELCLMLKVTAADENPSAPNEFPEILQKFYENTKDSVIFIDKSGVIKYANSSFLSLCKSGSDQLVLGKSFSDFLARGFIDLKVLIDAALENGTTMPFTTQFLSAYDIKIDIEITGTKLFSEFGTFICFLIRYSSDAVKQDSNDSAVSEQATQNIMKLVGSAPLKELVADTNDIVEKICIETALKMTKNNRVATAEMLTLSRQSLYVKLRKYNLL